MVARMRPVHVLVAAAAALLATLSGCQEETGGNPQSPGQTPIGEIPANLKVQHPLNVEPFLSRPCDLIDKKVIAELGEAQGKPEVDTSRAQTGTGPLCEWDKDLLDDTDLAVTIQVPINEAAEPHLKGIRGIYAGHESQSDTYLEPVPVPAHPGYPAVYAGGNFNKTKGTCPLYVGVTDTLTVVVSTAIDDQYNKACEGSLKMAASMIETLKKGA